MGRPWLDGDGARAGWSAAGLFVLAVLVIKLLHPPGALNWAVGDAALYHFPVINHFIRYGYGWDYPPGIAMLPGMHAYFAAIARALGYPALAPGDAASFFIQAPFGLWYAAAVALALKGAAAGGRNAWVMAPLLASSSYALVTWVWPTTDLGALAAYVTMIVILQRITTRGSPPGWGEAAGYALAVLIGGAMRQSFAPLGLGLAAIVIAGQPTKLWLNVPVLARLTLPCISGVAIVAVCFIAWGALLPPDQRHMGGQGINPVAVLHAVALSGLVGWPFALSGAREVAARDDWWRAPSLAGLLLFAAAVGTIAALALPMNPDPAAGRQYSLVWSLQMVHALAQFRPLLVFAMMSVGSFIWAAIAVIMAQRRILPPEIVVILLYLATLLVQANAWQRYVEVQILITLALFFARGFRPARAEGAAIGGWGLLYLALTLWKTLVRGAGGG